MYPAKPIREFTSEQLELLKNIKNDLALNPILYALTQNYFYSNISFEEYLVQCIKALVTQNCNLVKQYLSYLERFAFNMPPIVEIKKK